ncbi:L-selectin-like [Paramormyrops kingsleyae]|uniref:L-selectin-like n=1 Tax=Paramormyrops kingsleyae TaxID=1676925 RepID=UPI003B96C4A4
MLGLGENLRLFGLFIVVLFALDYGMVAQTKVEAWTYHYNTSPSRDWNSARQFCCQHYTDMVAIQNQKEIVHLNEILPQNPKYYWIGIRKVGNVWTWVGTNKTLTEESENWAAGEPNNKESQEDCVEIYIKREKETAKWNDETCTKEKGTICYNASCSPHACSGYGECVETIGNYSCSCQPGFQGPHCEEAQRCRMLTAPPHGNLSCSHPHGNFSFNSSCDIRCEEGYFLNGTASTRCGSLGTWTETPGMCLEQCNNANATDSWRQRCREIFSSYWCHCKEDLSEQNCKVDFRDFLQVLGGAMFIPTCCLVICVLRRRKRTKKHHTRDDSEPELQVALQSALESSAPEDTASRTHKLLSC